MKSGVLLDRERKHLFKEEPTIPFFYTLNASHTSQSVLQGCFLSLSQTCPPA